MDRGDLRTRAYQESATAAQSRAAECRERVSQLRARDSFAAVGVVAAACARDRLALARDRAEAAERRLAEAMRNHKALTALRRIRPSGAAPAAELPPLLTAAPTTRTHAWLAAWVHAGTLTPHGLWSEFVSLGGRAELLEFDAYLNGAWTMSKNDRTILEQVCWEHRSFGRSERTDWP